MFTRTAAPHPRCRDWLSARPKASAPPAPSTVLSLAIFGFSMTPVILAAPAKTLQSGTSSADQTVPDLAWELSGDANRPPDLAVSPDSRLVAVGGKQSTVLLYDIATGKEAGRLTAQQNIAFLAFLPDGRRITACDATGGVAVLDRETGRRLNEARPTQGPILDMAVTDNGDLVVLADSARKMYLFEPETGKTSPVNKSPFNALTACAFLADNATVLLAGGSKPNDVTLWKARQGQEGRYSTGVSPIEDVAASPAGPIIAVAGSPDTGSAVKAPGIVQIWSVKTGSRTRDIPCPQAAVRCVAFTPDGRYLVTGTGGKVGQQTDNAISIWEVDSGKEVHTFSGHGQPVRRVAVAPNGRYVVSAGEDGRIRAWRTPEMIAASIAEAANGDDAINLADINKSLNTTFPTLLTESKLAEAARLVKEAELAVRAHARQNDIRLWHKSVAPVLRTIDDRLAQLAKAAATAVNAKPGAAIRPNPTLSKEQGVAILAIRKKIVDLSPIIRSGDASIARTRLTEATEELDAYVAAQNLAEWGKTVSALFQLADQRDREIAAKEKAAEDKAALAAAKSQAGGRGNTISPGMPAPALTGTTLDGKPVNATTLKGKWVLVDFWATWCGPCRGEIPNLQKVYEAFGQDKRFIMISFSIDKNSTDLRKFVEANHLGWPQVFLRGGWETPVFKRWKIHGIPQMFLIDPKGTVAASGLRGDRIMTAVDKALNGK